VIFSLSAGVEELVNRSAIWELWIKEGDVVFGTGCYRGVTEKAYCMPEEMFNTLLRRWPFILHDQESILILGTPRSQNWRPATLRYLADGREEDLGMWVEEARDKVDDNAGWSFFNGHWFVCKKDPPRSIGHAKEQQVERDLAALKSIMNTIAEYSVVVVSTDPTTFAEALPGVMQALIDARYNIADHTVFDFRAMM
jgi:hypothetical protein